MSTGIEAVGVENSLCLVLVLKGSYCTNEILDKDWNLCSDTLEEYIMNKDRVKVV